MAEILVLYASRHGATRGIAERLGAALTGALDGTGLRATVADAASAPPPDDYDALVIGGAAYMGKWLESVTAYVREHRDAIARRPTWLYSSGPVGTARVDAKGNDLLAPPSYLKEAAREVGARGIRVFFGRWDPDDPPVNVAERLFRLLPVSRELLPVGDYRDWDAIDAWGREIATELDGILPLVGSA